MNLMTYALLKREINKNLTEGISISNMEIQNGQLIFKLSNGSVINAGKLPTSDLAAIEDLKTELILEINKLQSGMEEIKNSSITTEGGIVAGPLTLLTDPTDDFHAVTKSYLEAYTNEKVSSVPNYVVSKKSKRGFPIIGATDIIYKAEDEKKLYQWNSETSQYEALCEAEAIGIENIKIINGGNSNARN